MSNIKEIKIGLEIHAYLKTNSKLFCACSTKDLVEPNSQVCPICLGHPGSRIMLNEKVIELATRIGLALNCKINNDFFFSRKTYFYPDMVTNYQVTQFETPICGEGELVFSNEKKVRIKQAHIEWDPAALIHPKGLNESEFVLIDYNRSGLALIEIVTEPDLVSPKEAREFLNELENILNYLQVLKENTALKVDCNISLNGGNRVEIKNVSGFAAVEKALSYEVSRQKKELELGKKIIQHTRAFDAEKGITTKLRKKETEDDYGYIFEPDLCEFSLTNEFVSNIKNNLPLLPKEKKSFLIKEFNLTEFDATVLCGNYFLVKLFDELIELGSDPLIAARLLIREVLSVLNYDSISLNDAKINPLHLVELIELIKENKVSDKNVKEAIINYISKDKSPPKEFLKKNDLLISDLVDLDSIIKEIISSNQKAVTDYKNGNEKSLNFLSGLVMRKTRGKVPPQKVIELIKKLIN